LAKEKGKQWDGKSRVSNDLYRKRYKEIFGEKEEPWVEPTLRKMVTVEKEKTVSELLQEGFEEEQEYLKELENKL